MKITIICSDKNHPIIKFLTQWKDDNLKNHDIQLGNSKNEIKSGDVLFLISCTEIIELDIRKRFSKTLVIHESDLPKGRGWSPLSWIILEGKEVIPISLLEAIDRVDAGPIWKKSFVKLEGHELFDEIAKKVYTEKLKLMDFAIGNFERITSYQQDDSEATYYPRRTPNDHEIDVKESISEQFEKFRISDKNRYPCFFYFRDHKYKIFLEKMDDEDSLGND